MTSAGREQFATVKLVGEQRSHVFSDEAFDINLTLEELDSFTRDSRTPKVIELEAELCQSATDRGSPTPVSETDLVSLTIHPSSISLPIGAEKAGKPLCTTITCRVKSPVTEETPTYYIRFHERRSSSDISFSVRSATSKPIHVVDAMLKIDPGPIEWEHTFFKDEGGREKCMSVNIGLYDQFNQPIRNRCLELDLTLLYNSLSPVKKDGVFRVIGTSEKCVLDSEGKTQLDFRIEDVSKNHTGQSFIVEVSAKGADRYRVAPTRTGEVAVRSKRTKRPRPTHAPRTHTHPPVAQQNPNTLHSQPGQPIMYPSAHRLRAAMHNVLNWTKFVVDGLPPLKWDEIGYNRESDHPLYQMTNPNERINHIMNMYANETRDNLKILLSSVEESTQNTYKTHFRHDIPSDHRRGFPERMRIPEYPNQYFSGYGGGAMNTMMQGHSHSFMSGHISGQEQLSRSHQHGYPNTTHQMHIGDQSNLMSTSDELENSILSVPAVNHRQEDIDQEEQVEESLNNEGGVQLAVYYVISRQYKSARNHKIFGCPAYKITKELIGFYSKPRFSGGHPRFAPLSKFFDDFETMDMEMEIRQARSILLHAIDQKSPTLHTITDYGSLKSMVNTALNNESEDRPLAQAGFV